MAAERYIPTIIAIRNFFRELIWNSQVKKCSAEKAAIIYSQSKNVALKKLAISRLRGLQDKNSLPAVLSALADEDAEIKWLAVKALGEFGDSSCIELLTKLLEIEKMKEWGGIATDIIRALGNIKDKKAVNILLNVLDDVRYFGSMERSAAVVALGNIKAEEAVPILTERLQDLTEAESVRNNIIWALKNITGKDYF